MYVSYLVNKTLPSGNIYVISLADIHLFSSLSVMENVV